MLSQGLITSNEKLEVFLFVPRIQASFLSGSSGFLSTFPASDEEGPWHWFLWDVAFLGSEGLLL